MAKSTIATGPSATEHEMSDGGPVAIRRAEIGYVDRPKEEEPSLPNQEDGGDFSQSFKSDVSHTESNTPDHPSHARTTENPSKALETAQDSTAGTTDTDGPSEPQKRSSRPRKAAPKVNQRATRVRSTDDDAEDDFGDFG